MQKDFYQYSNGYFCVYGSLDLIYNLNYILAH